MLARWNTLYRPWSWALACWLAVLPCCAAAWDEVLLFEPRGTLARLPPVDEGPPVVELVEPPAAAEELPPVDPPEVFWLTDWHVPEWLAAWEAKLEVGLNGTQGNRDTLNSRLGLRGKRVADWETTKLELKYQKAIAESRVTQHEALAEMRHEWFQSGSPLSVFSNGSMLYNEFTAYDARVQGYGGLGYHVLKREAATLVGRAGAGASREIGGPEDRLIPEGLFGLEFERKFSPRHTMSAQAEVFNDLTDPADFRFQTKGIWEYAFDPEKLVTLKLEVTDRYDSTPAGRERNDLNYALLLLLKL